MGRRSNGEGSYRKLPSGNWLGQLMDGYTPEGKRNIINVTAPTKAEAQQKIRQYLQDRDNGTLLADKGMTFSRWAGVWYGDLEGQVQDSTYSNYKYTLQTLMAYFGDQPINTIKQLDVSRFLAELKKSGCSDSKVSKCKSMLIQIFSTAEENDLVLKNPALRARTIRDPNRTEENGHRDAFTDEEVNLLFEHLSHDRMGNSIRVMLISGLRVQELLALTAADIAEDGSRITVNTAVKMVDGKPCLGKPKSARSRRVIPIPEQYRPYVVALRNTGRGPFIWTSTRSQTLLYSVGSFRKLYYRAIQAVPGVRRLTPHCCRHTYVTRLEEAGVPMEMIARLAGHSAATRTEAKCGLEKMPVVRNPERKNEVTINMVSSEATR